MYQMGKATGDISHAAPALRITPTLGVVVLEGADTAGKGRGIADGYVDHFQIPAGRVSYVVTGLPKAMDAKPRNGEKVTYATQVLRAAWMDAAKRQLIKETLRGAKINDGDELRTDNDVQLGLYLMELGIPLDQHVVVIWGRQSGKQGGLYPEHDMSTRGLQQLTLEARARNYTVVLAGAMDVAKFAGNLDEYVCVLGEFWNGRPLLGARTMQVRLFYILKKALKESGKSLVHVGMRSGGLDAYGFSGQRIIYLYKDSVNDARMEAVCRDIGTYFHRQGLTRAPKRSTEVGKQWTGPAGTPGLAGARTDIGAWRGNNPGVRDRPEVAWLAGAEGLRKHDLYRYLLQNLPDIGTWLAQPDLPEPARAVLTSIQTALQVQTGQRGFEPAALQAIMAEVAAMLGDLPAGH